MPPEPFEVIREDCRCYGGAIEEYPWGCTVWKVGGKVFAIAEEGKNSVTVASTPEQQKALIQDPAISVASHMGRFGWVTIDASDASALEMALALIDVSYNLVVSRLPKKVREDLEYADSILGQ
jgi:predicted DNA-binding protein (MmcQ/YjbR family)